MASFITDLTWTQQKGPSGWFRAQGPEKDYGPGRVESGFAWR